MWENMGVPVDAYALPDPIIHEIVSTGYSTGVQPPAFWRTMPVSTWMQSDEPSTAVLTFPQNIIDGLYDRYCATITRLDYAMQARATLGAVKPNYGRMLLRPHKDPYLEPLARTPI